MLSLKHIALDLPNGAELIRDISLDIPDDRLVVVTGPNGGGKTTLAKLIAGLRQPTAGSISFDGQDITGLDITSRARMGIAYAFQQPVHFKGLRTRDILELAAGKGLASVAFCCISTAELHFPNELAAEIALQTVREWQRKNPDKIEVIFNVFKDSDYEIYRRLLR